jgi:Fe-S oxidoreductase
VEGAGYQREAFYEVFALDGLGKRSQPMNTVTIHDPCVIRFDQHVRGAVRKLVKDQGFRVEEMPHSGLSTLCCGEGGGVGFLAPDLAGAWSKLRQKEARTIGRKVVTYCAGCADVLSRLIPTTHVFDMIFEAEGSSGNTRVAKLPVAYWKRLKLKKWFKEHVKTKEEEGARPEVLQRRR